MESHLFDIIQTRHNVYLAELQCLQCGVLIKLIKAFGNRMGLAMDSKEIMLDPACVHYYNAEICTCWGRSQGLNYTLLDAMTDIGYDVHLYGKLDVGGYVSERIQQKEIWESFSYATGFHKGPRLAESTRSANILKPQSSRTPINYTDDNAEEPTMKVDYTTAEVCVDRLKYFHTQPWLLHCSINLPHPPFYTNEHWLKEVAINDIPLPIWINESAMHPADYYATVAKTVNGNFSNDDIQTVRQTYYAMNSETDYILGTIIRGANESGFDFNNTIFVFISDHGEMNMEHRQVYKNTMYEGSARIPMVWAGPNIQRNVLVTNLTQSIDFLPTLLELGGGIVPNWFSGYSVKPFLTQNENEMNMDERTDYITSQYHSDDANTGVFMVRRGDFKYIQYGHYLSAYQNYSAQLFNLSADPEEVKNVISIHQDIANEMEQMLADLYDYELIDCTAKQKDFNIFEEFYWNKYNETELYTQFQKDYHGFDQSDWQKVLDWRQELIASESCFPGNGASKLK